MGVGHDMGFSVYTGWLMCCILRDLGFVKSCAELGVFGGVQLSCWGVYASNALKRDAAEREHVEPSRCKDDGVAIHEQLSALVSSQIIICTHL